MTTALSIAVLIVMLTLATFFMGVVVGILVATRRFYQPKPPTILPASHARRAVRLYDEESLLN